MMEQQNEWACLGDTLTYQKAAPDKVHVVRLGRDKYGAPLEALILRDEEGELRAYLNLCQHLPIPLGPTEFLDRKGRLICHSHGARYTRSTGECVMGPCRGKSLRRLNLCDNEGVLFVERTELVVSFDEPHT